MVHPWVTKRRKGARKRREAIALEVAEERIERREIKLVEKATRTFTCAEKLLDFDTARKHVSATSPITVKTVRDLLSKTENTIINVRNYSKKALLLAQRLEADLLELRGADEKRKSDALSSDEERVIKFAVGINEYLSSLIGYLRSLRTLPLAKIIADSPSSVPDEEVSHDAAFRTIVIHDMLASLHKHLFELFALEKTVEELTEEYTRPERAA